MLRSTRTAVFLILGAAGAALAQAAVPPPPGPWSGAPAPLQAYFVQAFEADRIADPLQRCLAFPDLPGNQWGAQLAPAYCELLFGEHIERKQVQALLQKGALGELDALFRRDLDRHFSQTSFSEVIHRDMQAFDASDEAGAVSRLWLEKAPDSPFALTARAHHLTELAWARRGTDAAGDTPTAAMDAMGALLEQANALLERALKAEPRMIAAHSQVLNIGKAGGVNADIERAFAAGRALDPGCRYLSWHRMHALAPRWGGSYQQMQAYGATLEPLLARRPLLKLSIWLVANDMALTFALQKDWANSVKVARAGAIAVPFPTVHRRLATDLLRDPARQAELKWEALSHAVTALRFDPDDVDGASEVGRLLFNAGDLGWARRVLLRVTERAGDTSYANYLVGMSFVKQDRRAEAIPYLSKGLKSDHARETAMHQLLMSLMQNDELARADEVARMFTTEYASRPHGWWLYAELQQQMGRPVQAEQSWAAYLRHADRSNPDQRQNIAIGQRRHDALVAANKQRGSK